MARRIYCFPPIATPYARVLILGSMPGEASLAAKQYYAHPRNLFWRIIERITGVRHDAPYQQRVKALKDCRIALWDVLQSCHRKGSLDSGIDGKTMKPNDFRTFFREHPRIAHVFFNGGLAERCYRKSVMPVLGIDASRLSFARLPSTSPANASWKPECKRREWEKALLGLVCTGRK